MKLASNLPVPVASGMSYFEEDFRGGRSAGIGHRSRPHGSLWKVHQTTWGQHERDRLAEIERCSGRVPIPQESHRHGRVMMSGWDTVARCPYYSVSINPGNAEVILLRQARARAGRDHLQKGYNYWI